MIDSRADRSPVYRITRQLFTVSTDRAASISSVSSVRSRGARQRLTQIETYFRPWQRARYGEPSLAGAERGAGLTVSVSVLVKRQQDQDSTTGALSKTPETPRHPTSPTGSTQALFKKKQQKKQLYSEHQMFHFPLMCCLLEVLP